MDLVWDLIRDCRSIQTIPWYTMRRALQVRLFTNFWILSYSIWPPKLYSIFGHSSCLLLTSYNMKWFHAANLIISPVSIADDALYRCQVISEDQKICLHPQGLVMIYLTGAKWRFWSTSHLKASTSERPRPPLRPCHLRWGLSVSWPGLTLKNSLTSMVMLRIMFLVMFEPDREGSCKIDFVAIINVLFC